MSFFYSKVQMWIHTNSFFWKHGFYIIIHEGCIHLRVCNTECILTLNWKLKLIENMNWIHFNGNWWRISFNCHSHEMYIVSIAYSHFISVLRDKHATNRLNDLAIKIIFYFSISNFSSTKYFLTSKFPGAYLLFSEVRTLPC